MATDKKADGLKKICALTMVRNDEFFLRKWISYYEKQLGRENLYIYFDGTDQVIPEFTKGTNVLVCEHINVDVKIGEKRRAKTLSEEAARLLDRYDMVIGTDVDEFLAADPATGMNLREFLSRQKIGNTISGLGMDVGQVLEQEGDIDPSRPYLRQRKYAAVYPRYSKPSVLATKCRWGSGIHRVKGKNFHIVKDLYLFHFGGFDFTRLKSKMTDQELLDNGWGRHMRKRAATIYTVTDIVNRGGTWKWNTATKVLRRMQQLCRPIFAWNKPTVFGIKAIVEIPERFRDLI